MVSELLLRVVVGVSKFYWRRYWRITVLLAPLLSIIWRPSAVRSTHQGEKARQGDACLCPVLADLAPYRIGDTVLGGFMGIRALAGFLLFWKPIIGLVETGSG